MIKNNEDAIKHAAEVLHRNYYGEISDDHAKTQLFGIAVYNKLLKYRMDLSRLTGKPIEQIEGEATKQDGKMFVKKIR